MYMVTPAKATRAIGKSPLAFPEKAGTHSPDSRNSKAIGTPCRRSLGFVPRNDGPRLSAGEASKLRLDDSFTPTFAEMTGGAGGDDAWRRSGLSGSAIWGRRWRPISSRPAIR